MDSSHCGAQGRPCGTKLPLIVVVDPSAERPNFFDSCPLFARLMELYPQPDAKCSDGDQQRPKTEAEHAPQFSASDWHGVLGAHESSFREPEGAIA